MYIERLLKGMNVTIFAYGPTGSGKTFTMQGAIGEGPKVTLGWRSLRVAKRQQGIDPKNPAESFRYSQTVPISKSVIRLQSKSISFQIRLISFFSLALSLKIFSNSSSR